MDTQPNTQFAINLSMDQGTLTNLRRYESALVEANAYVIDSADMANLANGELRHIIEGKRIVKAWREEFIAPAETIIENAKTLFNPALVALDQAETYLRGQLKGWTEAEQKRVAEAKRLADETARKAQQEAAQKAAAERARAQQQAEEEQRKAATAEAERQRAEAEAARLRAEGDRQAAAREDQKAAAAAAESARRAEAAEARLEDGEAKAAEAQYIAMATAPTPFIPPAAIPQGFGMRKNWIAEIVKDETTTILAIAAVLATRPELVSLLKVNMPAANKLAKSLEKNFNVPGMTARNAPISASRAG